MVSCVLMWYIWVLETVFHWLLGLHNLHELTFSIYLPSLSSLFVVVSVSSLAGIQSQPAAVQLCCSENNGHHRCKAFHGLLLPWRVWYRPRYICHEGTLYTAYHAFLYFVVLYYSNVFNVKAIDILTCCFLNPDIFAMSMCLFVSVDPCNARLCPVYIWTGEKAQCPQPKGTL